MEGFRSDKQPEEDRNGNEQEKPGSAAEQVTLGKESDQAFMGNVPGVIVQPMVKLGRSGQGGGAQPQKQHQADKEYFAYAAFPARFLAQMHV